jgi:predicted nucleic acid-binding protein
VTTDSRRLFVLDTSFVSHQQRDALGPEGAAWVADAFAPQSSLVLAVSVVTVAEVRFGFGLARWGWRRRARVEQWLRRFLHLPVSHRIADAWARLKLAATRRGRTFSTNDLWIAAAGYSTRAPIVTCDRDFLPMRDLGVGVIYLAPRTQPTGSA